MKDKTKKCDQWINLWLHGGISRNSFSEVSCIKGFLKNSAKFTETYLCLSLFLMTFQALRPATLLKVTLTKMFSCEFCDAFKNTYFVGYLRTIASESVRYYVYIFLSEVCLEEEEEYRNYLRITPECFDALFALVKDDITK